MAHPSRPLPILGSRSLDRLRHAIESEHLVLDREQWFHILQAAIGHDVA